MRKKYWGIWKDLRVLQNSKLLSTVLKSALSFKDKDNLTS